MRDTYTPCSPKVFGNRETTVTVVTTLKAKGKVLDFYYDLRGLVGDFLGMVPRLTSRGHIQ